MHIVSLVAAILVGAAIWYGRARMVYDAGDEVIDSMQRLRGALRRRQMRRHAAQAPLASIREPAIAAVAFYLSLAAEKLDHQDTAKGVIRLGMRKIIEPGDMDDVLVFCEWAVKDTVDPRDVIRRFRSLWRDRLDVAERRELVFIAETVADVGGGPTEGQTAIIAILREALLS